MPPILYKFIAFELHYTFKLHYSGALIHVMTTDIRKALLYSEACWIVISNKDTFALSVARSGTKVLKNST